MQTTPRRQYNEPDGEVPVPLRRELGEPDRNDRAIREQGTYTVFLTRLLQVEVEPRVQKHLDLRIRLGGITTAAPEP